MLKKKPIRNDLIEAYGPKRKQSIGAYHLLALVQDEMADYDEKPIAILAGVTEAKKPALLVLTSERLFLLAGNLFTRDVISVPIEKVSTTAIKSGILSTFEIHMVDDSVMTLTQAQVATARDFQTALRRDAQRTAA